MFPVQLPDLQLDRCGHQISMRFSGQSWKSRRKLRIIHQVYPVLQNTIVNFSFLCHSDNNFRLFFNPSSTYFYVFYYRKYKSFLFGLLFFIVGIIGVAINLPFHLLKTAICNLFPFKLLKILLYWITSTVYPILTLTLRSNDRLRYLI